ncbi:MAG: HEAT repeat domain-containing protein [Sphingopyxis sp.]|nr:HEAT repeat domain-containing protein [Sphingopyxis sp.]
MIDEPERGGGQPPLAAAPLAAHASSRHDHYPRVDRHRRRAMQTGAAALDARLRAQDEADGGIVHAMRRLASADPDIIFTALVPYLTDHDWVRRRLADALALCAGEVFAMPPLRMFGGEAMGGLVLAEAPPITLSLMILPFNQPTPRAASVIFSPGHGLTHIVRSGGASMRRYHAALSDAERAGGFCAGAAAPMTMVGERPLDDGDQIRADQQCESFNLTRGEDDLVMLQLFVHETSRVPMREYDAATGRLIHAAAAGRGTSFRQMGLAVLRSLGRRDAAPLFVAALDDPDFAMRWQVMRELIALDAQAALPLLTAMAADDPHPEVRAAAIATLAMLRERAAPQPLVEMA